PERPVAKPLAPEVVEAWKKAGMEFGSHWRCDVGYWIFSPGAVKDPAALPAFQRGYLKAGVIPTLAAPAAPFALVLGEPILDTNLLEESLKDLAGLANLAHLDLSNTRLSDAGMKDIGRITSLRVLQLTSTGVTDAGIQELAGLKNLQHL